MAAEDRAFLQSAARAVLLSRRGTLAEQITRLQRSQVEAVPLPRRLTTPVPMDVVPPEWPDFEFFNGLGGFGANGREYVTILGRGEGEGGGGEGREEKGAGKGGGGGRRGGREGGEGEGRGGGGRRRGGGRRGGEGGEPWRGVAAEEGEGKESRRDGWCRGSGW